MSKKKVPVIYRISTLFLAVGCVALWMGTLFSQSLSDFWRGVLEGIAFSLIFGSTVILIRCFIRRKT